jgi:DNA polymerase III delta subunit
MIIFLYGSDSYRRNKNLRELIDAYRNKHREIDLLVIDLEDNPDDWLKVRDFLNQPSMFVESKVAVVKESNQMDKKEWVEVLKKYLKTEKTFILISDYGKPKKMFTFLTKAPVESRYFPELTGERLAAFVKKESEVKGLRFTQEAQRFFIDYLSVADDRSWLAVNELEKILLANFSQPIAPKDLRNYIDWLPKEEVFLVSRSILNERDWRRRLGFLESLFLRREEGARIFNSIAFQSRGKESLRLADYDVSVKSGGLEYEEALLDFVL